MKLTMISKGYSKDWNHTDMLEVEKSLLYVLKVHKHVQIYVGVLSILSLNVKCEALSNTGIILNSKMISYYLGHNTVSLEKLASRLFVGWRTTFKL